MDDQSARGEFLPEEGEFEDAQATEPEEDAYEHLSDLARSTDPLSSLSDAAVVQEIMDAGLRSALRQTFGDRPAAEDALQGAMEYMLRSGKYKQLMGENRSKLRSLVIKKAAQVAIDNHRRASKGPAESADEMAESGAELVSAHVDLEDGPLIQDVITNLRRLGLNTRGFQLFLAEVFDLEVDPDATDRQKTNDRQTKSRYRAALLKALGLTREELDAFRVVENWRTATGWNRPASAAKSFVRCAAGLTDVPNGAKERPSLPAWLAGLDIEVQIRALVSEYTSALTKVGALMRQIRATDPEENGESGAS
jgi:DNA-directed RNA polymerase specialized sigma24 family protein